MDKHLHRYKKTSRSSLMHTNLRIYEFTNPFVIIDIFFQQTWCVAKPSASDVELYNNMYYACSFVNCDVIHPQGACYEPQVLINQASVVMNSYYQKQGRNYWNCDFNKSALITIVDPSKPNSKLSTQV